MSRACCIQPVVKLRVVFSVILAVMLFVTIRASLDYSIAEVSARIGADWWFRATLTDAYCGFITFFCWVAYLEKTCLRRALWLLAILLLGNIAMAGYVLIRLFRLPVDAPASAILLRPEDRADAR